MRKGAPFKTSGRWVPESDRPVAISNKQTNTLTLGEIRGPKDRTPHRISVRGGDHDGADPWV